VSWSGASSASCSQAAATIGRLTTPTTAVQQGVNGILCTLNSYGLLASQDTFYKLASDTATNALVNLISSSFPLTAVDSPTFTANKGFQGNGTNSYLSSPFNPSTAGGHYTLNSASWMFYPVLSRTDGNYYGDIGSTDGTNSSYIYMVGSNNPAVNINSLDTATWFPASFPGDVKAIWIETRTASNASATYKSGGSFDTQTVASSALPNQPFYILGVNKSGAVDSPSLDQIGYAGWGAGLTANQAIIYSYIINVDACATAGVCL
jgi:hypothetical protein